MADSGGAKHRVLQTLARDQASADMRWSLFMAALESYRHDSILRPFPSAYLEDGGNKNFQALVRAIYKKQLSLLTINSFHRHFLNLFVVVPGATSQLQPTGLPPTIWDSFRSSCSVLGDI